MFISQVLAALSLQSLLNLNPFPESTTLPPSKPTCSPDVSISEDLTRSLQQAQRGNLIDTLIANMTIPELVMQLHLMSADNILSKYSDNSLFDYATRFAPGAGVGVIHDLYATNKTQYNSLQQLNGEKSRLKIPMLQFGECLHGVGSFKQSMFPQSIGLAASWDPEMVHRVGGAIGTEARSIGVHACLSPVLDLGLDPRWGRVQEAWGEDMLLTSQMGVAMASGLSKNGSWSRPDAVIPVVKHFAAHGSPQGGINGAPTYYLGTRQVYQDMLRPFKAVMDLGGARGVMMAYSELDGIPSHVHPMLYDALEEWGFDGLVTADDTGMKMLEERHDVANSPGSAIMQWFNAGGMIQYYDYPLDLFLNTTVDLVANGSVALSTLQSHVRKILAVKHDLGLFSDPLIPPSINPQTITESHISLTLEAAQKSIVLLENHSNTLPIDPISQKINRIALIGPFSDTANYGDYSGAHGSVPAFSSSTIRQGVLSHLSFYHPNISLVSGWGVNDWYFSTQRNINSYQLSTPNGTTGGLLAHYFSDTNFSSPMLSLIETPNRDWGLFPPAGLPSNNFSVIWEGVLESPVDLDTNGYIGVAISANCTAKLYIDGQLVSSSPFSPMSNIQGNIPGFPFTSINSTSPPAGGSEFTFEKGRFYDIKVEFQAWNLYQKVENVQSVNSQIDLFWNLVDKEDSIGKAVALAQEADIIILAVGANWDSDGEGGDRATLGLSANQTELAEAVFAIGKPVILVLQGGRPFAIPELYARSAAVLSTFFPGQSAGQAISDVLFGRVNPGGRIPISVPRNVGTLPAFYNYKTTARANVYTDEEWKPSYPFGYGLSYTTFEASSFSAYSSSSNSTEKTFTDGDTIFFSVTLSNTGVVAGSYVPQVYLLGRTSSTTQPVRKLVAFARVYLEARESREVSLEVEVDRYLPVLNRRMDWELEKGEYVFTLMENGGVDADTGKNVTMVCV